MSGGFLSIEEDKEVQTALQRLSLTNGLRQPPYRICNIMNKGNGIRATCNIPCGTRILAESPLFYTRRIPENPAPEDIRRVQYHVARHPEFSDLSSAGGLPADFMRIFQVNACEMLRRRELHEGIFMNAARLNHSCMPNAYLTYNEGMNCVTVHVIRNIKRNEEILVSYRQKKWSLRRGAIRQQLIDDYRFDCTCEACSGGQAYVQSSSRRQTEISSLYNKCKAHRRRQTDPSALQIDQQAKNLSKLRTRVIEQGLVYPAQAKVYKWQAEHYYQQYQRGRNEAGPCHSVCHEQALKAAKEKLYLDIMATGTNSQAVSKSLAYIQTLNT